MGRVICFPAERKPTSSTNVQYWTPGGPIEYVLPTFARINGNYNSTNGSLLSNANTNGDRSGNIFASSEGFRCTVQTGTDNQFWTHTFIGNPGFGAYNGSYIDGSNFVGSYVESSATSSWILGVKGFICEISDLPYPNDGSTAADSCGGSNRFRVSGVFVDGNGRIRVIDMCEGGTKITGHTWNTRPSDRSWKIMSYYSSTSNDMLNWHHIGWAIGQGHKRFCGGKTKYCTSRIRYLQPLISKENGGPLYTGNVERWAVCGTGRRWTDRYNGAILVV